MLCAHILLYYLESKKCVNILSSIRLHITVTPRQSVVEEGLSEAALYTMEILSYKFEYQQ